ncbi:MAG TPA: hypothetical protein VJC37_03420 [Planctomycetota bacterium]|nr:hypothetical protein [Planctomycetota bacterium]
MRKEYKLIAVLLLVAVFGIMSFYPTIGRIIAEDKSAPQAVPDDSIAVPAEKPPVQNSGITDPETLPVEIITPTHQVLPIFKMGDELNVNEELKWDGTVIVRTDGVPQSYPYSKVISQHYAEKLALITADQLNFKSERNYLSAFIKSHMPDEGKKTMTISLEGKTLALESRNYQVVAYEKIAPKESNIINDDYAYVNAFNWFYACLPDADASVAIGASYPIKSNELAQVIFKGQYNEKSCVVIGNGVLEEVVKSKKTLSARMVINVKIKQKVADTESSVELIGFCKLVSGSDDSSLEMEISGPFNITKSPVIQGEKTILSSTSGNLRIKSKVALKK